VPTFAKLYGDVFFYYNPDIDRTCIEIIYIGQLIDYEIAGRYTVDTGYSLSDISKSKLVQTCDDFIPSKYTASDYTSSTRDPPKQKSNSSLGALAVLAIIPVGLIILFCNCLKRRKDNQGNLVWVCRKRVSKCTCLCNRPRS
jgi:hypothetical protein